MMNNLIFTFSKPSPTSTVVSNRLALFVQETLNIPIMYDDAIADAKPDLLIIINGAFAFCGYLEELACAVRRAKRIVWIQNDYTIKPPGAVSGAESPFRKAFRIRHKNKKAPVDFWSTLKNPPDEMAKGSYYINWNALTYRGKPKDIARSGGDDLFYYGAFRQNRVYAFDRYFKQKKVPVSISSTSRKFETAYPRAYHTGGMISPHIFRTELRRHGLGLYIEDQKSHYEFHSPANRFYEMLSAGLPMVFEPESVRMLRKAGFDVRPYVVRGANDLSRAMDRRVDIATAQLAEWHRPYRTELSARLKKIYRLYTTTHMRNA